MVRHLKGLQDIISITIVHPTWQKTKPNDNEDSHNGWIFGAPNNNNNENDDDDKEKPTTFRNTQGYGGPFSAVLEGCDPNPLFDSFSIRDVYEKANDTDGKYSVPILWDKKKSTIVSNESADIIHMFNSQFNELCNNPTLDLSPVSLQDKMKEVDDWIYPNINVRINTCDFIK